MQKQAMLGPLHSARSHMLMCRHANKVEQASYTASGCSSVGPASCNADNCMPQIDFAPSMAALMGVPTPFGNIGKVSKALWDVVHSTGGLGTNRANQQQNSMCQDFYTQAIIKNAAQVTLQHVNAMSQKACCVLHAALLLLLLMLFDGLQIRLAGAHVSQRICSRPAGFSVQGRAAQAESSLPDCP